MVADLSVMLEHLVLTRCLPAGCLRQVRAPCDLPVRLERLLPLLSPGLVWCAYTDEARWWFATASQAERLNGAPALDAFFFSCDGTLSAGATWEYQVALGWRLRNVFDLFGAACEEYSGTPAYLRLAQIGKASPMTRCDNNGSRSY